MPNAIYHILDTMDKKLQSILEELKVAALAAVVTAVAEAAAAVVAAAW